MSVNNPHAICVWPGFCLISIKVCYVLFCSVLFYNLLFRIIIVIQAAVFRMKLFCTGLVVTKQVSVSESEVLQSCYGNKYTGAPKLKKSAGIG